MNSEFSLATHCLLLLACEPSAVLNSGKIAFKLSVHPVRVRKALGILKKNGYIDSREGLNGGFSLVKDPDKITLEEVYSITEPDVLKPRCKPSADICCPVDVNIGEVLASIFIGAEKNLQDYLKNYTIRSVMDDIKSRGPRDCGCGNSIF